jgi:hypothetical protein
MVEERTGQASLMSVQLSTWIAQTSHLYQGGAADLQLRSWRKCE